MRLATPGKQGGVLFQRPILVSGMLYRCSFVQWMHGIGFEDDGVGNDLYPISVFRRKLVLLSLKAKNIPEKPYTSWNECLLAAFPQKYVWAGWVLICTSRKQLFTNLWVFLFSYCSFIHSFISLLVSTTLIKCSNQIYWYKQNNQKNWNITSPIGVVQCTLTPSKFWEFLQ